MLMKEVIKRGTSNVVTYSTLLVFRIFNAQKLFSNLKENVVAVISYILMNKSANLHEKLIFTISEVLKHLLFEPTFNQFFGQKVV